VVEDDLDCLVPSSVGRAPTGTGALDGRTFDAKDLFAVAGHTSSFGLARWRDTHDVSRVTATAVERWLAAGAELAGLGKLDSLAYSLVGNAGEGRPPRNPRYPDRFTGGSTSGPAAAVAGGLADVGLGSDTAGSIRVPAAACGIWSIRPTHGVVPVDGVLPLAPSFDTVGLFAREPTLLRDGFAALAGGAASAGPAPRQVLLAADMFEWIDHDAADAVAAAASAIATALRCPLATIDLGGLTSVSTATRFARLQGREVWAEHGAWVAPHLDAFIDEVRVRLERCQRLVGGPDPEAAADHDHRRALRAAFEQLVGPRTCVVLPVLPGLPPRRDASDDELVEFRTGCFRLTAPASLTGAPQVVVPVHHRRSGNTYGVGLLGAVGSDRALLDAAVRLDGLDASGAPLRV
jgi:amidase